MKLRGYYGTFYDIPDENPFPAIDQHLATIRKNYPKFEHPDIDKLLDVRIDMKKKKALVPDAANVSV